jgi:ABC-type sugar transport system substrate-binding protein
MKHTRLVALGMTAGVVMLVSACSSSGGSSPAGSANPSTGAAAPVSTEAAGSAGSSAPAALKPLNIAYVNLIDQNPSLKAAAEATQKAGATVGDKVTLYDNQADPAKTIQIAQLVAQSKPDVVLDWIPAPQSAAAVYAQFSRAKIPCIAVDIAISGCPLFNLDEVSLGTDVGKQLAADAKAKGWNGSNTTYIIAQNARVGDAVNAVVRQAYVSFADNATGFQKTTLKKITATTTTIGSNVLQVDAGDEVDAAFKAIQNVLPSIPKNRNIVLFGITDESVIGAIQAFKAAGRSDYIVGGNGGDAVGLDKLRSDPNYVLEGGDFVPQWGEYEIAMAHALTSGMKLPDWTVAPSAVITKDNVDEYFDAKENAIKLPPLDSSAQYLAQTGVLQKFNNVQGLTG